MKQFLSSKYVWLAIAIIVLTPIVVFLSISSDETAPPEASPQAPPQANTTGDTRARESVRAGIYFPLFDHPGPLWENMLIYRNAHPELPWVAIVDPSHGPGEQYDSNYARNIQRLQAANVTVLGYVSTLWAGKSPDLVKEDIGKYKDWYNVDGILLDEMISAPGFEGLYSNFTTYAKSLGMSPVIGNVGTDISPTYAGTVDSISTVEGDRTPPLGRLKGWQLNYDKSNFLYITYSQSWIDPEYIAESTNYVDSIYITDDTMPFPYDDFPAYLDEVVAVLDPQGNNNLRTLSVRASDLRGDSLEGTLATVSPADNTITTLQTPLAHVGNVSSTYIVTALSNSTHIFDHWDDGSTDPSRAVTLDSSKVLRAYYRTPSTSDLHSSIVVNALTTQGGQLGMWISVLQEGVDSGSGLTPLVSPAQDGRTYTVTANDHQHLVFDHWEDGTTERMRTIKPQEDNMYLTAYYRIEKNPSLVDLTVDAYTLDGTEIRGLWSVITPPDGDTIGGHTPMTHVATTGVTYVVEAQDYEPYTFDRWEDGSTNRTRTVVPGSDTTLSAYYGTPSADLQVSFVSLSGEQKLSGLNATVTAMGSSVPLEHRETTSASMTFAGSLKSVFTVTAHDNNGYVFERWENGITDRTRNVILSNNTKIIAYYDESGAATS